MVRAFGADPVGVRLRPHRYLLSRGIAASAAFIVPVFAVLYYLTAPNGPWLAVLYLQIAAMLILAFAWFRCQVVGIWVEPKSIAERGFFRRMTRFSAADIGSMILVNTYSASQPAGVPQLFVRDHSGKQLVRMRGGFWSRADMEIVAGTLDAQFIPVATAMSTKEIHHEFPGLGYWFERRPVAAALVFVALIVAVGLLGIVLHMVVGTLPGN